MKRRSLHQSEDDDPLYASLNGCLNFLCRRYETWNLSRLLTCSSSSSPWRLWWRRADGDEEVRGQQMEQMSESTPCVRTNRPHFSSLLPALASSQTLQKTNCCWSSGGIIWVSVDLRTSRTSEGHRTSEDYKEKLFVCSQIFIFLFTCFLSHIFHTFAVFMAQLKYFYCTVQLFFFTHFSPFYLQDNFCLFFPVFNHLLFALFALYFYLICFSVKTTNIWNISLLHSIILLIYFDFILNQTISWSSVFWMLFFLLQRMI